MTTLSRHPLGKVLKNIQTGTTPSTSQSEFFGGDILWFTPGDIGEKKVLKKSTRTITERALKEGRAKLFEKAERGNIHLLCHCDRPPRPEVKAADRGGVLVHGG